MSQDMVEKGLGRESDDVIVGKSRRTETIYSTNRYQENNALARNQMDGKSRNVNRGILSVSRGVVCINLVINRGVTTMELIDVITSKENLNKAYKKVVENKGASGVDGMKVEELGAYIKVLFSTLNDAPFFTLNGVDIA